MSVDSSHIFSDIKGARKRMGLTQTELAKRSGVSRAFINAIEQGKANVSIKTIESLLNVLGMQIQVVEKPIHRGRVAGRFPNIDEMKKMRAAGEI